MKPRRLVRAVEILRIENQPFRCRSIDSNWSSLRDTRKGLNPRNSPADKGTAAPTSSPLPFMLRQCSYDAQRLS